MPTAAERVEIDQFMSSEWLQNNGMGVVLYRCPKTGMKVQAWFADAPADDNNTYLSLRCPACAQLHLVNRTGRTLGRHISPWDPPRTLATTSPLTEPTNGGVEHWRPHSEHAQLYRGFNPSLSAILCPLVSPSLAASHHMLRAMLLL